MPHGSSPQPVWPPFAGILADAPEAHVIDRTPPKFSRKNRQADTRGYLVVIIARGFSARYFPGDMLCRTRRSG
jgi:hypothetical protein